MLLMTHELNGVIDQKNHLHLEKRVFLHNVNDSKDLYIVIKVGENIIYSGKAKHPEANKIGVTKSDHSYGYFVDILNLNEVL
jgi:hypothetical protein